MAAAAGAVAPDDTQGKSQGLSTPKVTVEMLLGAAHDKKLFRWSGVELPSVMLQGRVVAGAIDADEWTVCDDTGTITLQLKTVMSDPAFHDLWKERLVVGAHVMLAGSLKKDKKSPQGRILKASKLFPLGDHFGEAQQELWRQEVGELWDCVLIPAQQRRAQDVISQPSASSGGGGAGGLAAGGSQE